MPNKVGINPENIMLTKIGQTQKFTECMIPFIQSIWKR